MRRITILTAAVLVCCAALVWGQEMPLDLIKKQQRQGTFYGSYQVPAEASGTLGIYSSMNMADLQNPALSMIFRIEVYDGSAWQPYAGITWQGEPGWVPPGNRPPPPYGGPSLMVPLEPLAGKMVRVELTIPVRMSIGAVLDIIP